MTKRLVVYYRKYMLRSVNCIIYCNITQMNGRSTVDKVMTSSSTWGFAVDDNLVKSG